MGFLSAKPYMARIKVPLLRLRHGGQVWTVDRHLRSNWLKIKPKNHDTKK